MHHSQSPFLHEEALAGYPEAETSHEGAFFAAESPFLAMSADPTEEGLVHPQQESFVQLMDELYDDSFEEALQELAFEFNQIYEHQVASLTGRHPQPSLMAYELLKEQYTPVIKEMEHFMDHLIEQGEAYDRQQLSEEAFDAVIDQYEVLQTFESPQFEHFWKKAKKWAKKKVNKVKKLAKKGLKSAKKLGFGFLLKQLKRIALPFLKGLLEKGIGKLPASMQPHAKKLRDKYLGKHLNSTDAEMPYLQEEFNIELGELLLLESEQEVERFIAALQSVNYEQEAPVHNVGNLQAARDKFVERLSTLEDEEGPESAVEEFLPMVIQGLKVAIPIIGRPRVVRFLSRYVAKLIVKMIKDKKLSKQLSSMMVDQGLKLLSLEAAEGSPLESERGGLQAIAATVEEALLQTAQLPAHVFQDEAILEGYLLEAFEQAAAVNLPDMLQEAVYRRKPELRETNKHKLFWKQNIGKRSRLAKFKKLNKELEVELTPYTMAALKTQGGQRLGSVLRDSLGINPQVNVPVKIRLYELMPGGRIEDIVREEKLYNGHGREFLHPLSPVAAGMLLGEPGLGCRVNGSCLSAPVQTHTGHRYYFLDIPGASPQVYGLQDGSQALRKPASTRVKLDFIQQKISVVQFFSEADAQGISGLLRQRQLGRAAQQAAYLLREGVVRAFKYPGGRQLQLLHPMIMPGPASGIAINRLPASWRASVSQQIALWANEQLQVYLQDNPKAFIEAANHEADGLTLSFDWPGGEFLQAMRHFFSLSTAPKAFHAKPDMVLSLQSDYRYD